MEVVIRTLSALVNSKILIWVLRYTLFYYYNILLVYAGTTIQCSCRQGYRGSGIGENGCVLVQNKATDPCANNPCGAQGICVTSGIGGFTCDCDRGFSGVKTIIFNRKIEIKQYYQRIFKTKLILFQDYCVIIV